MSDKRDKLIQTLDMLGDQADMAKGETAAALYMCTAQLTSVLLLVSEELCEAIKSKRLF